MRAYNVVFVVAACCVWDVAMAQTPIHQCKDAEGGIVYSQLPCKDEEPAKDDAAEAVEEPVSQDPMLVPPDRTLPEDAAEDSESDESAAACKKRYRDAIDEIDAEIRREYAPEKDAEYKERLLALTRQLRAC